MNIGVHCFTMKARTTSDNSWYWFTIDKVPTPVRDGQIVLLTAPNSPILRPDTLRRCSDVDNLGEGDVLQINGERYVICYERGFYAISENYRCLSMCDLGNYKVLGDYTELDFPISVALRNKVLYKYKDSVFRLKDICGLYDTGIVVRGMKLPVPIEEIHQECCITYKGQRVFLGDVFDEGTVVLHNGRVCLNKGNNFVDITTGGKSDGCIS